MKNIRNPFVAALIAITSAFASVLSVAASAGTDAAAPNEIHIYVSPQGNDAWTGENPDITGAPGSGPVATLAQAQAIVWKTLRAKLNRPITVYVRGGTYYLAKTLELIDQDSGSAAAPVTFRNYPNEKVVLSGARPITGFAPYKGPILKADVSTQGLAGNYFRHLFFGGEREPLARYPNIDPRHPSIGGWAFAGGTPVNKDTVIPNENRAQFQARPDDLHYWFRSKDAEVFVFARFNWWNDIVPIASADPNTGLVTLKSPASRGIRAGDRYYIRNSLDELDSPGEWYLDKDTNTLYFWPPQTLAGHPVEAPALLNIIKLNRGTSYVTFRGFTIEMCERSAVLLGQTSHCLIAGNIIRHAGDYGHNAVEVSGTGNGIVGNDIYDVAACGIHLTGGDTATVTPAGNYADNNYIHHTGIEYKQGVGIFLEGVGNRASHNLIHDTPRFGIQFYGLNHVIEYNHLRHNNLETSDTGSIYTGAQDWIGPRGSIIRGNYIEDTMGLAWINGAPVTPYNSYGIYIDDYGAGVNVTGNIIVRAQDAGIMLHNGSFNHIENNILADNRNSQITYVGEGAHGQAWTRMLPKMVATYELYAQNPAWNSVPGARVDPAQAALPDNTLMQGNYTAHNIFYTHNSSGPVFMFYAFNPAYNNFDNNLVWNFNQPVLASQLLWNPGKDPHPTNTWDSWRRKGMDSHSAVADPFFVDPVHGDYDLRPGSPAAALNIKPTPMREIGPYQDALRASWPIVEAMGARELGNR